MTITDLFIVGLGLDIAGASLLAKGLLMSTTAISAMATWDGVGYGSTVWRCRDRVDAEVGLTALFFGFVCQLFAYFAILAGAQPNTGMRELTLGVVLVAVVIGGTYMAWKALKEKRLKALLIAVARSGAPGEKDPQEVWTNQRAMHLVKLGKVAGWKPLESDAFDTGIHIYVKRVFAEDVPRYLPMPEVRD